MRHCYIGLLQNGGPDACGAKKAENWWRSPRDHSVHLCAQCAHYKLWHHHIKLPWVNLVDPRLGQEQNLHYVVTRLKTSQQPSGDFLLWWHCCIGPVYPTWRSQRDRSFCEVHTDKFCEIKDVPTAKWWLSTVLILKVNVTFWVDLVHSVISCENGSYFPTSPQWEPV